MAFTEVTLKELRDKLGIETDAHNNIDCPFCGGKKKLHFSDEKEMWNCIRCHTSGRPLHFFARYQLGIESLPAEKSKRTELSQEMLRFMGYDDPGKPRPAAKKKEAPPPKKPASDTKCHTVYMAMASLAMFQLHPDHKKELKRRGLTGTQIERNGYRTFPIRTQIPANIVNLYYSVDPALRAGHSQKRAGQIQLGLLAAQLLEERGHVLDGIPGFYKFGNHWCLVYIPGLLIPVRNLSGQIVRWQVRLKYGDPKYKTLSCSSMPGAVQDDISRCHFPLANDKPSDTVKVIFTEGPLKADVAKALSNDPCAFAAICGISNIKDLLDHCIKPLKKAGVKELYNGFDMDRLTNPNVRKGSAKLCAELHRRGMNVIPMYWGEKYATERLMIYQTIAKARHVSVPPYSHQLPVFEKLDLVASAINAADIDPGKQTEDSQHWESETKGIDDYLFSCIQKKTHTQTVRKDCLRVYHDALLRMNSESSH